MMEGFEVTVEAVKERLKGGEALFFVNLRHHRDEDLSLMKVRGALRVPDDEVERHLAEIPRDRTVIICSTCPGDESSMQAARMLRQHGWNDVHPLLGGFNAYLRAGLPVEGVGRGIPTTKMMLL